MHELETQLQQLPLLNHVIWEQISRWLDRSAGLCQDYTYLETWAVLELSATTERHNSQRRSVEPCLALH